MEVLLNANMCDQDTYRIAKILRSAFKVIQTDLCNDYGGTMEHLWIDFDLIERRPFPFRFQKKVGGGICKLTGLPTSVCKNVGHFSVRPDIQELLRVPPELVVSYALNLVFASTSVLIEKQKKLGGFDAQRFRMDFLLSCKTHGFEVSSNDTKG